MIQQAPQADRFKQQLRDSLQRETLNSHAVKVARHANVYSCGDKDEMVYFIESGQIKLLMLRLKVKNACLPSTVREIFSVSYVYQGQAHVWKQPPR